jgi:hypothetical protein
MSGKSTNPLDPSPEQLKKIRERAYHLWLEDGCPEGRDEEYWERARELQAIADHPNAGLEPNPMRTHPDPDEPVAEEAGIQENLGEFPERLTDQGDRRHTPMTEKEEREALRKGEL